LESYAVKLASRRLSRVLLDRLKENLTHFEQALEEDDKQKMVDLNESFHNILYRTANSEALIQVINELANVLYRLRVAIISDPKGAARALKDHRLIYNALKRGDAEKAAKYGEEHLLRGGRLMIVMLEKGLL
jgi:DNA-binding GntR family transcriptional regulator